MEREILIQSLIDLGRQPHLWANDPEEMKRALLRLVAIEIADLLDACVAFLREYEDASCERYFGQMLDLAFSDVLEPMYEAVRRLSTKAKT